MRRSFLAVTVMTAVLASMFAVAVATAASPSDVRGIYTATDVDGSNMVLLVAGGNPDHMRVILFDDGATACGLDENNEPEHPAIFSARASLSGDDLNAHGRILCFSRPASIEGPFDVTYTYDPSTDTLTDGLGVVYTPWP